MFDEMEGLVQRLQAYAPTEAERADPDQPLPQRLRVLVDELVLARRVAAAAEGHSNVILAELCRWAEAWQQQHDPDLAAELGPDDLVAAEIAPALHLAPVTAAIWVRTALELATRLPGTLAAMCRGELDKGRVLTIRDAVADLDDTLAAKVEATVLPGAVSQTAGELRRALSKAVIAADPDAAERRRKAAVRDRDVTSFTRRDGTGAIEAVLSAVDSGEIYDLIDQIARQTKTTEDHRPMTARRADAFVHLLLGRDPHLGPEDAPPPTEPPPGDEDRWPPHPDDAATHADPDWTPADSDQHAAIANEPDDQVEPAASPVDPADLVEPADLRGPADLVDLVEPADLDERYPPDDGPFGGGPAGPTRSERISELAALALAAMTTRRPPRLPWVAIHHTTNPDGHTVTVAELQGYGPVTTEYAHHLLDTGAATDPPQPSGRTPTPAQAATHDPPEWLDTEIRTRDGTCRYPGCARAAHKVDLDHTIPFPRGPTTPSNLGGLCRRHHNLKTATVWQLDQTADGAGTMTWTSRLTGRTYTTHPRGTNGNWHGTTSHQ